MSVLKIWPWIELPVIGLLVLLGWLAWPMVLLSALLYGAALVLFVLPYAWPFILAWRMERAYRQIRGR